MLPQLQQQPPSEQLISKLLMSFVERRVNPQTIADVVRAQIYEARMDPSAVSISTANGIIEVITGSQNLSDSMDILFYVTRHPQFPAFLSYRAATTGLGYALVRCSAFLNHPETNVRRSYLTLVECFSQRVIELFTNSTKDIHAADARRLLNIFKSGDASLSRLCAASGQLARLEKVLAQTPMVKASISANASALSAQSALDVLEQITSLPDHALALKGVQHFKLPLAQMKEGWKLHNTPVCLAKLDDATLTPFQVSFLCEWFFEAQLRDCVGQPDLQNLFLANLSQLMTHKGKDISVLKGVLRALQRDLCLAAVEFGSPLEMNSAYQKMLLLAQTFTVNLIQIVESNIALYTRHFAPWTLQIPVHPPESRLLTRPHWQWVRTLAGNVFEEDLRDAPAWVVKNSSRFTAQLFQIAPSFWLHDFCHSLVERLQVEASAPQFVLSRQHFDYVEFLVRAARKKSPLFASRAETLVALRLLGRLQVQEEQQLALAETRLKMMPRHPQSKNRDADFLMELVAAHGNVESLGPTTLARALGILLRIAREAAKQPALKRTSFL